MTDPVKIIVGEGDITEVNVPEYNLIQTGGGGSGSDGATFFPEVSQEGVISWTNDGGYDNPEPVNIKGPAGNDGSDGEDGEDGVSPTVTFSTITGGHTMTVTDKDHPSGQSINIMDGESGGSASMTILSYGNSTWADFIAAYNSRSIVYCRASSAADPSSGAQTRLAFMAYVNDASSPTSVEFQYYRSVSSHTDSQQGDQVFIYKLTSAGAWTVTVRDAFTKIVAGTNMTSSYSSGTLTLNATGGGGGTSDYDDLTNKPSINNVTLSGNKTAADLGLGTYTKPSTGIPQTDLASAVQNKLDKTVVVSDTQPTASENKLWVDTDAGAGSSYQVPTVAEMEAALDALGNPYFQHFHKPNITCSGNGTVIVDIPIGDVPSGWAATAVTSWVDGTDTTSPANMYQIFLLNEWKHVMQTGTNKTMHLMYSNLNSNQAKFTANMLVMYTRV